MRAAVIFTFILMLVFFRTVPAGSAQPTVQTLQASNVTDTSAELNGLLNTNAVDTDWYFSISDQNGNLIGSCANDQVSWNPQQGVIAKAPGSSGLVHISVFCLGLNGLHPSTTYAYELVAIWTTATTPDWQHGGVVSFTTLASLTATVGTIYTALSSGPLAETDAATGVTDTSATLNGVVTTNGQATEYMFAVYGGVYANGASLQNCPATPGVVPGAAGAQTVTCQASGLTPSTTYSFVLNVCWIAAGGATTCTYGSSLTFTTKAPTTKPSTDWALSNLRITPSSPNVGDHITFTVDLTALSTNTPYPQTVFVNWWVDGTDGNGQSVTYYGPTGTPQTITFNDGQPNLPNQWTATAGTHTLGATVDFKPQYDDPDRSNNDVSLIITVGTGPSTPFDFNMALSPASESVNPGGTASYVVSVLPLSGGPVSVSLTVTGCPGDVRSSFTTQSAVPPYTSTLNLDLSNSSAKAGAYTLTVVATAGGNVKTATATLMIQPKPTQTTTSQTSTGGSGWSDVLQQNSLTIIIALLALAAVLGVLAMRSRRQHGAPQPTGSSGIFCSKCGTGNPASNEFCRGCGNKLKGS